LGIGCILEPPWCFTRHSIFHDTSRNTVAQPLHGVLKRGGRSHSSLSDTRAGTTDSAARAPANLYHDVGSRGSLRHSCQHMVHGAVTNDEISNDCLRTVNDVDERVLAVFPANWIVSTVLVEPRMWAIGHQDPAASLTRRNEHRRSRSDHY